MLTRIYRWKEEGAREVVVHIGTGFALLFLKKVGGINDIVSAYVVS